MEVGAIEALAKGWGGEVSRSAEARSSILLDEH